MLGGNKLIPIFSSTLWGFIYSCRPCYLQNPCQYLYVGLWFVSDIVGSWKRTRCWCILTMLLNPTTKQALLPICSMCNSLSSSPWQKLPNMVWALFNAFASFKNCDQLVQHMDEDVFVCNHHVHKERNYAWMNCPCILWKIFIQDLGCLMCLCHFFLWRFLVVAGRVIFQFWNSHEDEVRNI